MTQPKTEHQVEICQLMTLSTAHIRPETRKALDIEAESNDIGLTVYKKADFGWFIYIDETALEAVNKSFIHEQFPDLEICIQYAWNHGCEILCFDCDAEPIPTFSTYGD